MKCRCLSILLAVFATSAFAGGVGGGGNPPMIDTQNLTRTFAENIERLMMSRMALLPVTAEDFKVESAAEVRSAAESESEADTDSK